MAQHTSTRPGGSDAEYLKEMVGSLTGHRRFVFLIMSYKPERRALYEVIARVLEEKFQVACIRADQVANSGLNLLNKIQYLIREAELVLAEISEPSPNVYYEIGYADSLKKRPLLIVERDCVIPTDLRGLEVVEYANSLGAESEFADHLNRHLRLRLDQDLQRLREMLVPDNPFPSFIVSSPKFPDRPRISGQLHDRRTYGDNLGIRGLFMAFGTMFGHARSLDDRIRDASDVAPWDLELVPAHYDNDELQRADANLYLIGSRKVNKMTAHFSKIIQGPKPLWTFEHAGPGRREVGDWPVRLVRHEDDRSEAVTGRKKRLRAGVSGKAVEIWDSDYGIIMRGSHAPSRIALIMAGAHSLGTGAACLAATSPNLIDAIRKKLPPGVIEDKSQAFWVLVKAQASGHDYLLDECDVSIEEAGVFAKHR